MAENDDDGEKTEDATPRRRAEAREKGQVPLSTEIVAALLLCGWTASLALGGGNLARALGHTIDQTMRVLGDVGTEELSVPSAAVLLARISYPAAGAMLALIAPLFILGLLASYGQIGLQLSPKSLEVDLAKLNPVKGLGRLFSARSVVRTTLASLKIMLIAAAMVVTAWMQLDRIVLLAATDLGPALAGVGHVALRCVAAALIAIMILAAADAAFQRWQHERDLKMSRKEIREEHRSLEGDPHIKARIRRVQRELASRRMMSDVPDATVVVTNPTHYAIALRYERSEADGAPMGAPRVVAKGADSLAQRIKEVAREAGVLLYEDVPLARALHARCELGDEVPVDLYQAVAEVLAYVYRVQGVRELQGAH